MKNTYTKAQRHYIYNEALEVMQNNTFISLNNGIPFYFKSSLCWTFVYCLLEDKQNIDALSSFKKFALSNKPYSNFYYDGMPMDKTIGKLLPEFIAQKPKEAGNGDCYWFYGEMEENYNNRIQIIKNCINLTK